jgi:drug/metabolite transporter (DMT)-like permease
MELAKMIVNALAVGSLGTAAWAIWDALKKRWPQLETWGTLGTRACIVALCALLTGPVFAVAVAMLWLPAPTDWRGWVSEIGSYTLVAFLASQTLHAAEKDRLI